MDGSNVPLDAYRASSFYIWLSRAAIGQDHDSYWYNYAQKLRRLASVQRSDWREAQKPTMLPDWSQADLCHEFLIQAPHIVLTAFQNEK